MRPSAPRSIARSCPPGDAESVRGIYRVIPRIGSGGKCPVSLPPSWRQAKVSCARRTTSFHSARRFLASHTARSSCACTILRRWIHELYWALEHRAVPIQAATPPPPTVTVGARLSRTSLQSPLSGCFSRRRPLGDCFLACLGSMVQGPRTGLLYLLAIINQKAANTVILSMLSALILCAIR